MSKIEAFFIRFDKKCMEMSDLKFTFYILSLIMIYFIVTIPIGIIYIGVENLKIVSVLDDTESLGLFVSAIVLMPYIETILFHIIPLELYCKLKDKFKLNFHWDFIVLGLCGLSFGIVHAIHYPEITMKGFDFTLIGILYGYVFFRYKRLGKSSTNGIWAIHTLNNLIALGPRLIGFLFN